MADGTLTKARERRGWQGTPIALRIAALYVAARVVTTGFLFLAASLATDGTHFGAHASLLQLALGWDAQWYWFAAINGYPSTLPLTDGGLVAENQWAFMPLYAYLAAAFGMMLGSWVAGAVAVSLVAGYLSCLVMYRMLRLRVDESTAQWAVLFFAAGPLAAMFHVGYAESLFMLWLLLALWLVMKRAYAWVYLLIPLMGFTRPGVLAFALFLGAYGISRWLSRDREALVQRELTHIVALALWAVIVGFAWQGIAGLVTGDAGAYLATEFAWRRNWLPGAHLDFIPFEGFFVATTFWFETWGLGAIAGYVVLVVSVAAAACILLFEPHVKQLGREVRLWTASYLAYLLVVFFPQSSMLRLLLPISPLWGAAAIPRSKVWRGAVLIGCLLAQWWWIYNMYAVGTNFWQIP